MKALVIGGAGFIGNALCQELTSRGIDYVSVDSGLCPIASRRPSWRKTIVCDFTEADFTGRPELRGVSHVIHLAALGNAGRSMREPEAYIRTNLEYVARACAITDQLGAKLIFISSASVYGDDCGYIKSVYGLTKQTGEALVNMLATEMQFDVKIIRPFSVYGEWARPDNVLVNFASRILDGEPVKIFGGGQQTRPFTYVGDVATVIADCLSLSYDTGFPIEAGMFESTSVIEVARKIAEYCNLDLNIIYGPSRECDIEKSYPNHLFKSSANPPRTTLDDGLPLFLEWFKKWKFIYPENQPAVR